jgi:hypothetical protein
MPRKILLDSDILPYQMGFASEESTYETEDGEVHSTATQALKYAKEHKIVGDIVARTSAEPLANALKLAKNLLLRVQKQCSTKQMRVFLTGGKADVGCDPNFRIATGTILPYKGNRTQAKPLHYQAIRDYLTNNWGAEMCSGYEADDALGFNQDSNTIIATIDKDLDQVTGAHYNWNKDKYYEVTEEEGRKFFYTQLLTGDSTDNIRGIAGIGQKKAEKALAGLITEEDLYWKCVCMYENSAYERPFDAMVENGQLLFIMREENVVWQPPK